MLYLSEEIAIHSGAIEAANVHFVQFFFGDIEDVKLGLSTQSDEAIFWRWAEQVMRNDAEGIERRGNIEH